MQINRRQFIPLYLRTNIPLIVYIINSEIYWLEETMGGFNGPASSLFLIEINKHKNARKVIPSQLLLYLQQLEKEEIFLKKSFCFCGEPPGSADEGDSSCLAINMTINNRKTPTILLRDFAFIQRYKYGIPKDYHLSSRYKEQTQSRNNVPWKISQDLYGKYFEVIYLKEKVTLSAEEAFLLFANMNVSWITAIWKGHSKSFEDNLKNIQESIEKYSKDSGNKSLLNIYKFCCNYLIYLNERLIQKSITPREILRLNGADSLVFLVNNPIVHSFIETIIFKLTTIYTKLPIEEKTLYYILLLNCKYFCGSTLPLLEDFYAKNQNLWIKLTWEVRHEHNVRYIGRLIKRKKIEKQYK
ncbi:MAG: hypothetical protein JXA54_01455 [Candidatus Heimdallarchaeota archaeon]|nr:hypothetical protein [Candidatus Heimdallarchaeota archaeon]